MSLEDAGVPREPRPIPNTPESVFAQLSMKVAISKAKQLGETYKVKAKAYQVEVSDHNAVEKAMGEVVRDFGKLDVFVANAGMAISKPIIEQTIDEYKEQMSVNVFTIVPSMLVPFLRAKGLATLSYPEAFRLISSTLQWINQHVHLEKVYNSTKTAVNHIGKSLAREWRESARVNIVSPGFFNTKMGAAPGAVSEAYRMTPLGRQGHVKEIKGLYLYLASDASSYQTGSDVMIDGGYILP
ncbi:NAD(P)-binding protein [Polychaeton citri CBS 116435]|uniref:NAD(P)-binding protein n=1 Tax=Polychaeton citri CBS 116435 TaxID=1314669 RepID=A0A9P4Q7T5_9PEZI|nr:NAD(P)-binding protein [Polychaeton citri CBS 116435]